MRWLALCALFASAPAQAEMLVAARMLPANTILGPGDIVLRAGEVAGTIDDPDAVIGLETRVVIYPGRPVLVANLGAPALIERNEVVTLIYQRGTLLIATEARALERAGVGDMVKVMNLASRNTVSGRVDEQGRVIMGPSGRIMNDLEDFR